MTVRDRSIFQGRVWCARRGGDVDVDVCFGCPYLLSVGKGTIECGWGGTGCALRERLVQEVRAAVDWRLGR